MRQLIISRDEKYLYVACDAGILMYNIQDGNNQLVRNYDSNFFAKDTEPVLSVGENNMLAIRKDRNVTILEMETNNFIYPHYKTIANITIPQDCQQVIIGSEKILLFASDHKGNLYSLPSPKIDSKVSGFELFEKLPDDFNKSDIAISLIKKAVIVSAGNRVAKKTNNQWKIKVIKSEDAIVGICILNDQYVIKTSRSGINKYELSIVPIQKENETKQVQ